MSATRRLWDALGWFITGYTVYSKLKALSEAKDELYSTLSPEQQAQWASVFGVPNTQVMTPIIPPVVPQTQSATVASPIEQMVAGT